MQNINICIDQYASCFPYTGSPKGILCSMIFVTSIIQQKKFVLYVNMQVIEFLVLKQWFMFTAAQGRKIIRVLLPLSSSLPLCYTEHSDCQEGQEY